MEERIYSDDFYINDFPNHDLADAKQFIEMFMKKPPQNLFSYLTKKNHFGKLNPEFQAVIMGEPKTSLFGQPQAAVLLVHSNFIAYTTNPNVNSSVGVSYGYATFDNQISVTMDGDQLTLKMPYETILFGVHSNSTQEDYRVLEDLIEQNISSIDLFHEVLPEPGDKPIHTVIEEPKEPELHGPVKVPVPVEKEIVPVPTEEETSLDSLTEDGSEEAEESFETTEETAPEMANTEEHEPEEIDTLEVIELEAIEQLKLKAPDSAETAEAMPLEEPESLNIDQPDTSVVAATAMNVAASDSNEEWGHTMMEENTQDETVENVETAENEETLIKEDEHASSVQETDEFLSKRQQAVDPRFQTKQPIISGDSIPEGFVYAEPVIYVNSVRPGIFKSTTAKGAYLKAYDACLEEIVAEIDAGRFDAVFNLQLTTQSVESYYDVVVTGDAVVYDR